MPGERLQAAGFIAGRWYIEELTTQRGALWRPLESYRDEEAAAAADRFRHLPPSSYPRRLVHVIAVEGGDGQKS